MGLPGDDGKVRYTYRMRLSAGAQGLLLAEWDRCRWVWNQCVAASNAAHRESLATGVKVECGPAQLDKRLTGWRAEHEWLAAGSSVAAQQTIRDYGRARAKALTDRKDNKLPGRPSSMRIYRDSVGRWWCSFVVPRPETQQLRTTGLSIGIDWGVADVAITT